MMRSGSSIGWGSRSWSRAVSVMPEALARSLKSCTAPLMSGSIREGLRVISNLPRSILEASSRSVMNFSSLPEFCLMKLMFSRNLGIFREQTCGSFLPWAIS